MSEEDLQLPHTPRASIDREIAPFVCINNDRNVHRFERLYHIYMRDVHQSL